MKWFPYITEVDINSIIGLQACFMILKATTIVDINEEMMESYIKLVQVNPEL